MALSIFSKVCSSDCNNVKCGNYLAAPGPPAGLTLSSSDKTSVTVTWT